MTCLAAAAGFGAFLFPDQRLAFLALTALFLTGALYSAYKAVSAMKAKPAPHPDLVHAALLATLEMQFGEQSPMKASERLTLAKRRLDELESEIEAGDPSHAQEVLLLRPILLQLGSNFWGTSTGAYRSWHSRLETLAAKVAQITAKPGKRPTTRQ